VLVVENLDDTLSNKKHFLNWAFVTDDHTILLKDPTEHRDDELVCETALTLIKEMIEGAFELLEYSGALNQLCLHLGGDLLVEGELFDDEVEIIEEGLLYVFTDVTV